MSSGEVSIIGAGIVGVAAACWLQRAGFSVTLIDSGPVGEGASFGNAGNISPGSVVPYAFPGFLRQVPGWLLDAHGPLAVRAGYLLKSAPWLLAAAKGSSTEAALATSRAMRSLHGGTFEAYDELTRGTEAQGLIERSGQLYVSEQVDGARGSQLARFMREAAGVRTELLDGNALRELEPTLSPAFKSGMLIPGHGRLKDPHRMVRLLAQDAERRGVRILRGSVGGFQTQGERVTGILLAGAVRATERVVIAAGAASGKLSAQLGTPLPVEAERGYHITIAQPGVMPRLPLTHVEAKFVASPMSVGLRLAGTAEFAGIDSPPNWKRADMLITQAQRMFPGVQLEGVTRWCGNRPSLPDGLPVLGAAPRFQNVWFAFGNSHFGMTAGPVMGKLVTELISGRPPSIDLTPFRAERFNTR